MEQDKISKLKNKYLKLFYVFKTKKKFYTIALTTPHYMLRIIKNW